MVVVRIDQGHVRNAVNSETAERLHDELPGLRRRRLAARGGAHRRRAGVLGRAPTCATSRGCATADRSGPTRLAAHQAGDRGDRGLVRGRWRGAGGVVRPPGGRRVGPHRLPRAALGRAAHRRRHLPPAADRRPRPSARPHPHRPGDRRRGGRADGLRQPGRARRRGAGHRGRDGRRDRRVPVARRRERPQERLRRPRARPLEEALAIEDELGRQTIFADGFREGVDRFNDHQATRDR